MTKPDNNKADQKEEPVGTYSLTGKDLPSAKERVAPNKDFDTRQRTLPRGIIASLINGDEHLLENGGQQHEEFDNQRPTLQGAPSLALIERRERKTREVAALLDQLVTLSRAKATEEDEQDSYGWSATLDEISYEMDPEQPQPQDDEPIQLVVKPQSVAEEPQFVIESASSRAKEDDTLIMDLGVTKQPKDEWTVGIQEFAEEFQQKTGEIVLSKGNLEKIKKIITALKEMGREEREIKFSKIPLIIRKQILKILALEAAQKRSNPKPPTEKKWPPIKMTVSLGKKVRVSIAKIPQNRD